MRGVIVIQPARSKPFGPALNGENRRKTPCGVRSFQVGWGGAAFGPPFLLVAIPLRFFNCHRARVKYCLTRAARCMTPVGGALFLGTAIAPPSFDIARLFES
jgi:hypothetical protein